MKSLIQYIYEYRTIDEIKVYLGVNQIKPIRYVYDEESLNKFLDDYKKDLFKDNKIYLCELKGNKWQIINEECKFDLNKPLDTFLIVKDKEFNKQQLINDLENATYIIVIVYDEKW